MIAFDSKDFKRQYKNGDFIKIGKIYGKKEAQADELAQLTKVLNKSGKELKEFNFKMQEMIGRIMTKLQQGCKSEQILIKSNERSCDLNCDICKHIDIQRSNERINESHKMLDEYIEREIDNE